MIRLHRALCAGILVAAASSAFAQHRLVTQGKSPEGGGRLVEFDAEGRVVWEMPWGSIHDLHVLANGNLMVQDGPAAVVEIEPSTKRVVWRYDAARANGNEGRRVEVHAFQPLGDGRIMIAESGPARIIEIDRLGQLVSEMPLVVDRPHHHTDTRLVRKLAGGTYLVCHEGDGVVREYDAATGAVVWQYDVPLFDKEPADGHGAEAFGDKCFAAVRLASGNTLIATGNGHSVLEVDPAGEIVWKLEQSELEGITLAWVTTLEVLENGNYMIGNCHAGAGQPLLIELEPKSKKVVWTFDRWDELGDSVSNSALLDVGPEAALLSAARGIHRRVVTLDTHKDISSNLAATAPPVDLADGGQAALDFLVSHDPRVWGRSQVDFPKMRAGAYDVGFYIVYVGQGTLDEAGYANAKSQALAKFEAIHRMCERFPEEIGFARTPADVLRLVSENKLVAAIGIENGYAMGEDLALIERFHELGARYMSITHNDHSQLGDSNTPEEPIHGGLSDLGRRAVVEMNRVGIMVDVSHAGKETMMQTLALSKAPVIASHSGARALCDHSRNLDDEQLLALKANGGVVQAVAFASYVKDASELEAALSALREELGVPRRRGAEGSESAEMIEKRRAFRERAAALQAQFPGATVSDFVDHIDHMVGLIGIEHVAISSDFDGGGGVQGWNDASETFNVTLELVRRGYDEAAIGKLWSGNTLRLWAEVEEVARAWGRDAR